MTVLVTVDLEEGDLSDFTSTVNATDLSVGAAGAMVGSNGLSVVQDGTATSTRGESALTITTNVIRWRFYFDPNGLSMGGTDDHVICHLHGTGGATTNVGLLYLDNNGGTYQIRLNGYDDAAGHTDTTYTAISDTSHYIECQIERATTDVASDGTVTVWIDGTETAGTVTTLDNYDLFPTIDEIRIGAAASLDTTTTGTYYFDDLIVNDDGSEIGSAVSALEVNITPATTRVQGVKVIG